MSDVFKVPVPFFFEGTPDSVIKGSPEIPQKITRFLATTDGVALARAFTQIKKPKLRHSIVNMVIDIAKRQDD